MKNKTLKAIGISAIMSAVCLLGCAQKGKKAKSSSEESTRSSISSASNSPEKSSQSNESNDEYQSAPFSETSSSSKELSSSEASSEEKQTSEYNHSSNSEEGTIFSSSESKESGQEETSSENPDEKIYGKINVNDVFSHEIVLGEDNALDLDEYVSVSLVSSWSIVAKSETIKIDGHKIIGVQYGVWEATIIAGKTKRAISGNVISENKLAFNEFFDSISDNYMTSSFWGGLNYVAKDYVLNLSEFDSTAATFSGIATDGDMWYSFDMDAGIDENYDVDFSAVTTFKFDPGYGQNKESLGYKDIEISGSDFTETLLDGEPLSETDSEGYTWFEYDLSNDEADDYGDTRISKFIDALGLSNYWRYMEKYVDAASLIALYSPYVNEMQLYPVSSNGEVVQSIEIGEGDDAQTIESVISISAVNEVKVDAVEDWIAKPVYPEKIDISPLKNFFDELKANKAYEIVGYARWYDISSGTYEICSCPENYHYSDGTETLLSFDYSAKADWSWFAETTSNVSDQAVCDNGFLQKEGIASFVFLDAENDFSDDKYPVCEATGTYDESTGEYVIDESTINDLGFEVESIWDTSVSPYAFASGGISYGDSSCSILDLASFREVSNDVEDLSRTYSFNTYGKDADVAKETLEVGTLGYASALLGQAGYWNVATISSQGWEEYCDLSFNLSSDSKTLSFTLDFRASEFIRFEMGWSLSGVSQDASSSDSSSAN